MKNKILKVSALVVFIISLPLMSIELMFRFSNPIWRIKRDFYVIMFIVSLGQPKTTTGTGNITDKMVEEYLEHHRSPSNNDTDNIILE